ncbi:MAG TPA: NnrU family protein [Terracidiphilus sp.]|nr:NnrU family protein [Terracidiphilus sp.]
MAKGISVLYGVVVYLLFLATFLYAIGFVWDVVVPKTLDSGAAGPVAIAVLVDAILLGIFAVQHSVMARPWFKRAWTKVVPRHAERTTYVLLTNLCLILLYWQWRPLPSVVWDVENAGGRAALIGLSALGWLMVLVCTFLIDHGELFGLRQVLVYAGGKEFRSAEFKEPLFYKWCRHPMMLGFLFAFWAAPRMTMGHLLFAVATSGYILLAIQFEEHDLMKAHGDDYRSYRGRTSMILPMMKKSRD